MYLVYEYGQVFFYKNASLTNSAIQGLQDGSMVGNAVVSLSIFF